MKTTDFISANEAAAMSGVTTMTIRNLCKAGAISYQMHGNLFYPSRSDIEKYATAISKVFLKEKDIEIYDSELEQIKSKLIATKRDMQEQLEAMNMFPERIDAIEKMLETVIRLYELDDALDIDFDIMFRVLQGESLDMISNEFGIERRHIRQWWTKSLRNFSKIKNEIYLKNEQIEQLTQTINELKQTIKTLNDENGLNLELQTKSEYINISRLLLTRVRCHLSGRISNALEGVGIYIVRDIVETKIDIRRLPNLGKKSISDINEFLKANGLTIGMDLSKYPI